MIEPLTLPLRTDSVAGLMLPHLPAVVVVRMLHLPSNFAALAGTPENDIPPASIANTNNLFMLQLRKVFLPIEIDDLFLNYYIFSGRSNRIEG